MVRACWLWCGLLWATAALAEPEWKPLVEPDNQIFPSLELALATVPADPEAEIDPAILGEQDGLIGVELSGARPGSRVQLLVRAQGLIRDSTLVGRLPAISGDSWQLMPSLAWDYEALARVRQSRPLVVEFALSVDGVALGSKTQRVRLRSVNDALYWVDSEDDSEDLDFNWMFAAYVNEDHPLVDEILRLALESDVVSSFDGYQSGDSDQVLAQVFAIWHVLQQRGVRYSSITRTANEHATLYSQHVRFIDESWNKVQANCADGSVLFASVLRKIDIAPVLVLVPGHMFLGFALDEEGEEYAYLETTMLGDIERHDTRSLRGMKRELSGGIDLDESLESFAAALEEGQRQVDEASAEFADEKNLDYQFIDIQAARESGVMPIANQPQ